MPLRYLLGPVPLGWSSKHFPSNGDSFTFDAPSITDAASDPDDPWRHVMSRLPRAFAPDAIFVNLAGRIVPPHILRYPAPLIALVPGWKLQWQAYRRILDNFDFVLTDSASVDAVRRIGVTHVRAADLSALYDFSTAPATINTYRDIAILIFAAPPAKATLERSQLLTRIFASFANRNVVLALGVPMEDCRHLFTRSRIVVDLTETGGSSTHIPHVVASQAMLFLESHRRRQREHLVHSHECVFFDAETLEDKLTCYLGNENAPLKATPNAPSCDGESNFYRHWRSQLDLVERDLPTLQARARLRRSMSLASDLRDRTFLQLNDAAGSRDNLIRDVSLAIQRNPRDPDLRNYLGVLALSQSRAPTTSALTTAANAFQEAWRCDPRHVVAGLNLVETLVSLGLRAEAVDQARRTLGVLDIMPSIEAELLDAPLTPGAPPEVSLEWERAAWSHLEVSTEEAKAKKTLLQWRLHSVLSELTGEIQHCLIAYSLRSDLPSSAATLGRKLMQMEAFTDAVNYLHQATTADALNVDLARDYDACLTRAHLFGRRQLFRHQRRQLAAVALIPMESWFQIDPYLSDINNAGNFSHLRIVWHGEFDSLHSFSIVNQEICSRLISSGHDLCILPPNLDLHACPKLPMPHTIAMRVRHPLDGPANVHISNQWPPSLTPPVDGHWVIMQPWEFGSIPRDWLKPMRDMVDEIWVPSHFVRDCFIKDGIPDDRIFVVPNGISQIFLDGERPPRRLHSNKQFKFLFVGGTIDRKGIDVLLKAYGDAFSDRDDVCLVIKDMGVNTFYHGHTAESAITNFRRIAHAPEIEYLDQNLSMEEMASLYSACNCLVHPFRAEGFGLPVAEAMASGLPVIVTGFGAALDFCRDDHVYFVPAKPVTFSTKHVKNIETVDYPFWAEPSGDILRYYLHYVYQHRDEAAVISQRAQKFVRTFFTWERTLNVVNSRLQAICSRPVRRICGRNT